MFWKIFVRSGMGTRVSFFAAVLAMISSFNLAGCGGSSAPLSISVTSPTATVDGGDSLSLTAAVANDKSAGGVSWAVSGGGTLSNQTTTSATYTAPSATASSQAVTVTVTSIADTTKSSPLALTVPAAPSITSSSLAAATVGTTYTATLGGSGGITPYKWTITSGALPASLSLASGSGVISGTPNVADVGTTNLTFNLTDSGTATALTITKSLSLVINPAPAITFTTPSLASATYNVAYNAVVAATGGAGSLTYTLANGPLPAGLSLSTSGVISGTPTAAGTFPITVKAADGFGDSNTKIYGIVVSYPQLNITTPTTLPASYGGTAYSHTLAATGGSGSGYSWTVTSGGTSLAAAGLSLSGAGVLSGATPVAGTANFTVKVTDSASNTATANFSVTINAGLTITTGSSLSAGYGGTNYSQTLAATGGTGTGLSWVVTSGGSSLTAVGLSLSSGGVLSGLTPVAGSAAFTVKATDSASNTATATFSVTINAGLTITTGSKLPSGYGGVAYSQNLTATGGTGTGLSWSITSGGSSLTAVGLNLSGGVVSGGTPIAGGASFTVKVTDSASNTASATFSVTINAALTITTPTTLPGGYVGSAYSQALAATGGSGTGLSWTVTSGASSLTAVGLSVSGSGIVSGSSPTAGTANFTVKVADSASNTTSQTFSVTIGTGLTITTGNPLPAGYGGTAYSQTLAASGGTSTGLTWTVTAGGSSLTAVGLSVSGSGVLSGATPIAGSATFTVKVTDSASNTASSTFSITIDAGLTISTPATLPTGFAGAAYGQPLEALGGTGLGLSWTVTSGGSSLTAVGLSLSSGGVLSGATPVAGSASFTVKVTDSGSNTASQTFSVTINGALTITSPATLPGGTAGVSYSQALTTSGGTGTGLSWSVTSGGSGLTAVGLSLSGNGVVSGSSPAAGTATFTAMVTDSAANTTSKSISVTISAGSQVSGQVSLNNICGGSGTVPTVTISINTTPAQQTTTDSNGNYSFTGIPNGTYTITPSITGASSVFYPATQGVTLISNSATGENFSVSLGYSVKGTVSYSGTQSGQVYLNLYNNNCGGGGGEGTSISFSTLGSGGAFTINGVPPGSYTLQASMDNLGNGAPNATNPAGSASVAVSSTTVTGVSVTLVDPTQSAPTTGPNLKTIAPMDLGAVISIKPITNSNSVEMVTSYTLEWSTSSTFSSASSVTFAARGTNSNVWFVNNGTAGISGSFTNNTPYYFRARGNVAAGSGPWTVFGSPTAITIGAPSGAGFNTVTGKATIPSDITPSGPLYVGYYDQNTNTAYATRIASPTNSTSGNAFTVTVPNGSNYFFFGILDQNNDGTINAGDVTNTNESGQQQFNVVISGNLTGQNETLPDTNSTATVQTQFNQNSYWNGTSSQTSTNYNLNFNVRQGNKLPVSVQLTSASNPNVVMPVDISNLCQGCGSNQFTFYTSIATDVPVVNDTYTFHVTYSDGTTSTAVSTVTAVLGNSALATNLAPQQTNSTSTTPTFTWTYPSAASSYIYSFYVCCGTNGNIWQIPGNNSNTNGFTNSQIPGSLTWGTDPTDSNNTPSTGLTTGTTYDWSIQSQDTNGNSAQNSVWYQP